MKSLIDLKLAGVIVLSIASQLISTPASAGPLPAPIYEGFIVPSLAPGQGPEDLPLTIENDRALPPLTSKEQTRLHNDARLAIQDWIAEAKMGERPAPKEPSEDLQHFQQTSQETSPAVAPFLGLWEGTFQPSSGRYDYLNIFPAIAREQVCILKYSPRGQGNAQSGRIEPPIFELSKATVAKGYLLGDRLRSSQTSIQDRAVVGTTTKFLAVDSYLPNNHTQVFSLAAPPSVLYTFRPHMMAELSQALTAEGCTTKILARVFAY